MRERINRATKSAASLQEVGAPGFALHAQGVPFLRLAQGSDDGCLLRRRWTPSRTLFLQPGMPENRLDELGRMPLDAGRHLPFSMVTSPDRTGVFKRIAPKHRPTPVDITVWPPGTRRGSGPGLVKKLWKYWELIIVWEETATEPRDKTNTKQP